ncbi:IS1 family transposase [Escherichia coli]|nr:IS1 family transposase [Escherichia coli]
MELLLSLRIRSLIFLQKLIGRNNLTQRTRIKRLARRTIYFSRTVVRNKKSHRYFYQKNIYSINYCHHLFSY